MDVNVVVETGGPVLVRQKKKAPSVKQAFEALENYMSELESKSVVVYTAEDGSKCTAYGLISTPTLTALLVHMETGVGFPFHSHPYPETFYVMTGAYRLVIGGKAQVVKAGDIVQIPEDCLHGTQETLAESWTLCVGMGSNSGYPGTWPDLHPDILRLLPGVA